MRGRREPAFGAAFESVLLAAQSGAPWALERLYQAFSPAVLGYLRVQGATDPEDLTNDVFLAVLRKVVDFRGDEARFRSWVFTIAHSRVVDERRRALRRPPVAGQPVLDRSHQPAGDDTEADALERLSRQRVQALCEQLVPDQRDVLLLRLLAGLTVDGVAEALEKSPGAIKALQRRGLANLRKILHGEPVPL